MIKFTRIQRRSNVLLNENHAFCEPCELDFVKGMKEMNKKKENLEMALENIEKMIESLHYGTITVVVQDNFVVQIEKNEKIRIK